MTDLEDDGMRRRPIQNLAMQLACTLSIMALLSSCTGQVQPSSPPPVMDRETVQRLVLEQANLVQASTSTISYRSVLSSPYFVIQDQREGKYYYQYNKSQALMGAASDLKLNEQHEEYRWLTTRAFLRQNDGSWETSTLYPDQSYSALTAYQVFSQLTSELQYLEVEGHPDLAEFFYSTDRQSGLKTVAQLADINIQQLPVEGLRVFLHFFVEKATGFLRQLDLSILDQREQKNIVDLRLLFEKLEDAGRLMAPSNEEIQPDVSAGAQLLDERERWNFLSAVQQNMRESQTYSLLSDIKYLYSIQGQNLRGHTVHRGQLVRDEQGYYILGDRRINNDRMDRMQNYYEDRTGTYLEDNGSWIRQNIQPRDLPPAEALLNDLLKLNQGLHAASSKGRIVFSYSGSNPLFLLLCEDLFSMDMAEYRSMALQIDVDASLSEESQQIDSFRIRLRSAKTNQLDLTGQLYFVDRNKAPLHERPSLENAAGRIETAPAPQQELAPAPIDGPAPGEGVFHPAPEHQLPAPTSARP